MLARLNWISGVVILAIKPSSKTSTQSGRWHFHPRHTLQSYYDKTPPFIYQRNLLWRKLLLLEYIIVLGLGHKPNIWTNNELMGPRPYNRFQRRVFTILIADIIYMANTNIVLTTLNKKTIHIMRWVQANIMLILLFFFYFFFLYNNISW